MTEYLKFKVCNLIYWKLTAAV
uniref:Uncharacterized protein n=1 Tax=Anguilla anguilla TaxID=7936 RepID=A0A0E9PCL6_ANGAN